MELPPITGRVKSWNGARGFGFITCDQVGCDVYFMRRNLPEEAREVRATFLEGRKVALEANEDAEGFVKATVVKILATDGQPLAGIIKSYNEQGRYGFLMCSSLSEDVRFRSTDLPPKAPLSKLKGKLVIFDMQRQPDGKPRVVKMEFQIPKKGSRDAADLDNAIAQGVAGVREAPSMEVALDEEELTGSVKSYSQRRGYGFIVAPGQPMDIKFGKADLLVDTVKAGTWVTFVPAMGSDGRTQARQVQAVGDASTKRAASPAPVEGDRVWNFLGGPAAKLPRTRAAAGANEQDDDGDDDEGLLRHAIDMQAAGQSMSGTIKTYTRMGYGFITCPDVSGSVFFTKQSLPEDLRRSDLQGKSVNFELTLALDGRLRAAKVSLA